MSVDYMWIRGRKYYYYDSYGSWKEAYNEARRFRKKNGRYYIQKIHAGGLFPRIKYCLYLTNAMRLSFI